MAIVELKVNIRDRHLQTIPDADLYLLRDMVVREINRRTKERVNQGDGHDSSK